MRRGRIFIYLALILVVGLGAAYMYFKNKIGTSASASPTPVYRLVDVIIAGQTIPLGTQITNDVLSTMKMPEENVISGLFTDANQVIGQFAKSQIEQGMPITTGMVSNSGGFSAGTGSPWAIRIPAGQTAMTIPSTRLSMMGYGLWAGDHVDLIACMLLVDVDASYQSLLPNSMAGLIAPGLSADKVTNNLVAQSVSGALASPQGRAEFDANFQTALYILPSEPQRPRLVCQMVMQNKTVLQVGDFSLQNSEAALAAAQASAAGATPDPNATAAQSANVQKPDIITLIVNPQEAVILDYLLKSNAQLTLILRSAGDSSQTGTEAATLAYLLSQYNIPVPAKLPYALEPRIDELIPPFLPNDVIVVTPQP